FAGHRGGVRSPPEPDASSPAPYEGEAAPTEDRPAAPGPPARDDPGPALRPHEGAARGEPRGGLRALRRRGVALPRVGLPPARDPLRRLPPRAVRVPLPRRLGAAAGPHRVREAPAGARAHHRADRVGEVLHARLA